MSYFFSLSYVVVNQLIAAQRPVPSYAIARPVVPLPECRNVFIRLGGYAPSGAMQAAGSSLPGKHVRLAMRFCGQRVARVAAVPDDAGCAADAANELHVDGMCLLCVVELLSRSRRRPEAGRRAAAASRA